MSDERTLKRSPRALLMLKLGCGPLTLDLNTILKVLNRAGHFRRGLNISVVGFLDPVYSIVLKGHLFPLYDACNPLLGLATTACELPALLFEDNGYAFGGFLCAFGHAYGQVNRELPCPGNVSCRRSGVGGSKRQAEQTDQQN